MSQNCNGDNNKNNVELEKVENTGSESDEDKKNNY